MTAKIKRLFIMGILSAIVLAVMPIQQVSAAEGDVYSVTYNLTGADVSPLEMEVIEGSGLDVVFTANAGYELPDEISVQVAGEDISDYIYESGNLIINEVYGDVIITLNAVPTSDEETEPSVEPSVSDTYSISYDLYEVKASKQEGNVRAGTKYSVKLKAKSGFRLDPLNVAVKLNGEYVTSGYSFNEGLLEIDSVNGDIVIEAIAVQKNSSKKNKKNTDNSTNNNNTTDNSSGSKNTGSSSNSNGSKSTQALANNGGSVQNYNTGSYRAPKTGDNGIDIRYYGALAFIFIGTGLVVSSKKYKED